MLAVTRASMLAGVCLALVGCSPSPRAVVAPVAADDALRAIDARGSVLGFVNPAGGHSWLGIPYAAPPVGERRWRAPQPPAQWDGVREALQASSPCIQYGWALGGIGRDGSHEGSEDCLYLNVHAPRLDASGAATERLPVMVWVHGGGNTVGEGAAYDGGPLAAREKVVVVTINYRLGPLGWFRVPDGAGGPPEDPVDASGNYGILDEIAALQWVHEHVGAFGGDPANVTVFGQSAGATDALALLIAPRAEGLVQRVIVQSLGFGFAAPSRATNYVDDPEPGGEYSSGEILLKALIHSGRAADRVQARALAATLPRDEIAALLRALDPWSLYALYHPTSIETDRFPTVFQDGVVLRAGDPAELLANRATHLAVPVLIGTNLNEPKLFMAFDPRLVATLAGLPLRLRDPNAYAREADYRSRLWRADGVDRPAHALASGATPVYAYRWDWRDEGRRFGFVDLTELVGAAHGLEIPFVFGSFDTAPGRDLLFTRENRAGRVAVSDAMMSYWAEFAYSGTPGRGRDGTLPDWPAWPAAGARYLVFDVPARGGLRTDDERFSREDVLARIDAQEPPGKAACAMFRATFRSRVDPWADAAWLRFRGGACAADGAARVTP